MCCEIVLQNYDGSYYPGDTIDGRIVCTPETSGQQQDIRIRLELQGKESTVWRQNRLWMDSQWEGLEEINAPYGGVKIFYSSTQDLTHNDGLISDRYEIPFSFTLPSDLPGSYSGNNGTVEFSIEADVDYSNSKRTKHKTIINVVSPVDYSNSPLCNWNILRHHDATEPTFNCFGKGACANMEAYLDKVVYGVGDFIRVHIVVDNGLKTAIPQVTVDLKSTIMERATLPEHCSKYYVQRLSHKTCEGVKHRSTMVYDFELRIPETTVVHNFNGCSLFQQQFAVTIQAWCESLQIMQTNCNIYVGSKPTSTSLKTPSLTRPQYLFSQDYLTDSSYSDDERRINHYVFKENLGFNVRDDKDDLPLYDETMLHPLVYPLTTLSF